MTKRCTFMDHRFNLFGVRPSLGCAIWNLCQRGEESDLLAALQSDSRNDTDLNYLGGLKKQTPLMVAITWLHTERAAMIFQAGADANIQDGRGDTALIHAVRANNTAIFAMLVESECINLDLQNTDGYAALHCAVRGRHHSVVQLLITRGADLNLQCNGGYTALFMAIDQNDNDMAALLIQQDSTLLNLQNDRGTTALHWAVGKNNTQISLLLLKRGAKLDIRNEAGYTAMHHAARKQNHTLLESLVYGGADWRVRTTRTNLLAHQFKSMSYLRSCILKQLKWASCRDFLMFLYMSRYRGSYCEHPPPSAPPSTSDQRHMTDAFSMYDITRYISTFLICPSKSDLLLLKKTGG